MRLLFVQPGHMVSVNSFAPCPTTYRSSKIFLHSRTRMTSSVSLVFQLLSSFLLKLSLLLTSSLRLPGPEAEVSLRVNGPPPMWMEFPSKGSGPTGPTCLLQQEVDPRGDQSQNPEQRVWQPAPTSASKPMTWDISFCMYYPIHNCSWTP